MQTLTYIPEQGVVWPSSGTGNGIEGSGHWPELQRQQLRTWGGRAAYQSGRDPNLHQRERLIATTSGLAANAPHREIGAGEACKEDEGEEPREKARNQKMPEKGIV